MHLTVDFSDIENHELRPLAAVLVDMTPHTDVALVMLGELIHEVRGRGGEFGLPYSYVHEVDMVPRQDVPDETLAHQVNAWNVIAMVTARLRTETGVRDVCQWLAEQDCPTEGLRSVEGFSRIRQLLESVGEQLRRPLVDNFGDAAETAALMRGEPISDTDRARMLQTMWHTVKRTRRQARQLDKPSREDVQ